MAEEIKPQLNPKEEFNELVRLRGVAHANQHDMDSIFNLYKKYINPALASYKVNCQCSNAIHNLYWELLGWFAGNTHTFEQ